MFFHLLVALLIQAPLSIVLRNWWAGGAVAASWAISREITQAEYRWIEHFGGGQRANMPWWGALDVRVWHLDAILDWTIPTIVVLILATFFGGRGRDRA